MPNIAQQDYIRVPIADGTFQEITDEEKAILRSYLSAGVLMDVIIVTSLGEARVIAYQGGENPEIVFFGLDSGDVGGISF